MPNSRQAANDFASKADLPTHLLRIVHGLEAGGIKTDSVKADPEDEHELHFEVDLRDKPGSRIKAIPHPVEEKPHCKLRWAFLPNDRSVFIAIVIANQDDEGWITFQLDRCVDDCHWIPGFTIDGCHEGEKITDDSGYALAVEFADQCPEFTINPDELDIPHKPVSDERAEAIILLMARFCFKIHFRNNPEKRKDT